MSATLDLSAPEVIHAPHGTKLHCANWQLEAPMRMLMNNLDPAVAEDPAHLVVYGGSGKAARNWEAYHRIIHSLKTMKPDETLVVQSGKPVAIFQTHEYAPRVLIANSNIVPHWASWEKFRELERAGLMMYGQMTAGSWIYIGTQGILQGTYETFAAAGRTHFNGDLTGRVIVTAGLGGMGGAQPLAATMAGACCLAIEVDRARIERRIETRYLDKFVDDLDEAIALIEEAKKKGEALSVGFCGNAADIIPELARREWVPDMLTDQTSAHDSLHGYVPAGISLEDAIHLRADDPEEYIRRSMDSMADHVRGMLALQKLGAVTFDYGNNLRGQALEHGVKNAFDFPGFVPAYIRPQFCEGRGPFRWAALSGDPKDIHTTDQELGKLFPEDESLARWLRLAKERVAFQGLPSRICWLGYGEREKAGLLFNDLVRKGKVSAPIVIGRDHLDCGSVASPNRETEGMKDGSDAISDWVFLNAMLNTACGATWVSVHHGGGVGIGYSQHAGMVICADGTDKMDDRLSRVLTVDPGMGVARHVDAGYERADEVARERGVKVPGVTV